MSTSNSRRRPSFAIGLAALTGLLTLCAAEVATAAPAWFWSRQVYNVTEADGHVQAQIDINSNITWVSVPTTDSAKAQRFQSMMTAAMLSGRRVNIKADTANTSSTRGCANSSACRIALGFGIVD